MNNDAAIPAHLHAAASAAGTDLARHLAADARTAAVTAVTNKMAALGIKHVLYQFVSVTGRVMGKAAPAAHWPAIAARGVQLWYGAVADVCADRQGNYIGYGANASELVAIPDPETFCQLPWNPRVARVFCTLFAPVCACPGPVASNSIAPNDSVAACPVAPASKARRESP